MTRESLFAYVFWHWRMPSADRGAYEAAQQRFQRALAESPSAGFVRSFSHAIMGAPWANDGGEAYEDWYLVRDWAGVDLLDTAAVSASRKAPHDAAASLAAAGTAGLYRMERGEAPTAPRSSQWFSKPAGLTYSQLYAAVEPALGPIGGSLWVRKMTLGPSPEMCVLGREPAVLGAPFQRFAFQLRPVWDGSQAATAAR